MIFEIFVVALALRSCQAVDLGIDIPNQSGEYNHVSWALKNIKLIDVDDKGHEITPDEQDKHFRMKITGITMKGKADVFYKTPFNSNYTKLEVSLDASANSFTVDFDLPYHKVIKCDLKLDQVNVAVAGDRGWIYNSLALAVKPYIKGPLEKAICKYATTL